MCNSHDFITPLKSALKDFDQRQQLLQQPELLQAILKDIPTREWLFIQACQVGDRTQATKVRLLIVEIMQGSKQIKPSLFGDACDTPDACDTYNEFLAQAWIRFGKNFEAYNPRQASFTDWFNQQLERSADELRNF